MRFLRSMLNASIALTLFASAHAQTWTYVAYSSSGAPWNGTITLKEKDGAATFQMIVPGVDKCFRSELKATVERTQDSIIIAPEPLFRDCPQLRFLIKKDGTGGAVQIRRASEWTDDTRDRRLTIAH